MKLSHILLLCAFLLPFQAHTMEPFDDGRPNEHLCPITLQVMKDPVVAADGHSYERSAISEHFNRGDHPISPLTRAPLNNKELFDNHALKTMISEWKPGRQSVPSVLEMIPAENIVQRVKEEFKKNTVLLNSAKDQHIVAFLGNTGAGKSTLVNLLAGKKIIVSDDSEDYVLADPDDKTAMVIGTMGSSETLYPKAIDVDGLRFFDLPGFNDTDGSERNLINAAFTRQILLDAASVRLVFVVGQDQFTGDRGASVKKMFHAIKQLFVNDQDINLVNDGVFVATKMICNEKTEMTDFLLKRTDAKDKIELNEQLKSWSKSNRLCRMFHPILETQNVGVREQILTLIKNTRAAKVHGLNVSVLYPPDTKGPLERMFLQVFENTFDRKVKTPLTTLADYDRALSFYTSQDFWPTFDAEVCGEENSIGLLKEFCINPYKTAFRNLEKENEEKRQAHIQDLRKKRQTRIKDIEQRTETRAKEVISSLVPKKENDYFVSFDFAYHKDFYDQVCSPIYINQLATDPSEQEVVRRCYAGFISLHSHMQMRKWDQKFSGTNDLIKQLATMEERLKILEAERAEEKLQITQAADQREKQEGEKLVQERLQKERLEQEKKEKETLKEAEERRIQKAKEDACKVRKAQAWGCVLCGKKYRGMVWKTRSCYNGVLEFWCDDCVGRAPKDNWVVWLACSCGTCR